MAYIQNASSLICVYLFCLLPLGSTVSSPTIADDACNESYLILYMCLTKLWKCHLLDCVCARSDNVGQDAHSSLSLTPYIFLSLNNPACSFSEKPCCAVLRGTFVIRCNLNVCSYLFGDFISKVTRTYFVPLVKPRLTLSPPLLYSSLHYS